MIRLRRRIFGLGLLACFGVGAMVVQACGGEKSAIMLAVTTDMKAPKDVNAVSVTVTTNNSVKYNVLGRVTPQGDILLPATLAIVEPEEKGASIRIRVMAFQDRKARVLRDVRTSIPSGGRVALLRIPLNFVNDGSTQGELPPGVTLPAPIPGTGGSSSGGTADGDGGEIGSAVGEELDPYVFVPNCPNPEDTWIDGECKDAYIDPNTLPDYSEEAVFGKGGLEAACFDTAKCFAGATPIAGGSSSGGDTADASAPRSGDDGTSPDGGRIGIKAITLDSNACTLQLNGADPAKLNLAIVTPETGDCIRPGECYVPIDRGAGGWTEQNGTVTLPKFVCRLLGKGLSLYQSSDAGVCSAKEESNPICPSKPGEGLATRDGGSEGGTLDGGGNVTGEMFVPEDFPATVAMVSERLVFASRTRIAAKAFSPGAPVEVFTFAGNKNAPLSVWSFGLPFGLTDGSPAGFLFNGASTITPPSQIQFPQGFQSNGVALVSGGNYVWAVGGVDASGLFKSSESGTPSPLTLSHSGNFHNMTVVVPAQNQVLWGDSNGRANVCYLEGSACSEYQAAPQVANGRIDQIVPEIANGDFVYMLAAPDKVIRVSLGTPTPNLTVTKTISGTVDVTGETGPGGYYRHGLVATPSCVIFSAHDGQVHWATTGNDGKQGVIPTPSGKMVLGLAIGPSSSGLGPALYYAVWAPITEGGGIYTAALPPECNSGSTMPDAGPQCIAGGGTCDPENGPMCCQPYVCSGTMCMLP